MTRRSNRDPQWLTKRMQEVLRLMVTGLCNKEIATELGIAERTVKTYRSQLLSATKTRSACQLGVWAERHGYAGSNPPTVSAELMSASDAAAHVLAAAGGAV